MVRHVDRRIVVAGGGAVGSTIALALARAGARVTLADPAPIGANASGVAAGMLAPVFETLLDAETPPLALMRDAMALWPDFAAGIGVTLDRAGAMAVGTPATLDLWQAGLTGLGLAARRLSPGQARARAPGLATGLGGLWTTEDGFLDPHDALTGLRRAFAAAGGATVSQSVAAFDSGAVDLADGRSLPADALVLATGASPALVALAPALCRLTPIKGHILRAAGVAVGGPILRLKGAYVVPSPAGAVIGATMEVGRADDAIDPVTVESLHAAAAAAVPALAEAQTTARTGVRAATPDGLPLVGAAGTPRVWLAVGGRRNGWLLAPLIAEILCAAIAAGPPGRWAAVFDPARF